MIKGLQVIHEYEMDHQRLDIQGHASKKDLNRMMLHLAEEYEEFLEEADFTKDLNGFLQLFFIYCIIEKAKSLDT